MRIAFSILLIVTACAPASLVTQAPQPTAPIATGDRLRVTVGGPCCNSPAIGIAASLSRDSLVLQPGEGVPRFAIARSDITRIERWNAGRTHKAADAALGALAGAATGALIGYQSSCAHCDGDWRPYGAFVGAIGGGVIGMLAGVIVGSYRHAFWETIPQL